MKTRNWSCACVLLSLFCFACSSPSEPESKPPNILFAIADDASFPHMSAYGCSWVNTPGFDRVAREGILFTHAYTPNAKCSPSRSCILTGRNSWQLEEATNHVPFFPAKFTTYAEALDRNGYHVGYTAKGWAPGNAGEIDGKKRQLLGPAYNEHTLEPPAKFISKNDYTANFKSFMEARPKGEPFCFWYGAIEPHRAYEFGAGAKVGGKNIEDVDSVPTFWPDNPTTRTDMMDYAFELEYFDKHLQQMLEVLDEAGELDNTIVVVTADNGMPFPRIKGQAYEYSNHLPLAIRWPDGIAAPGRTVDDFVNFIDFAPTFLEVAGLTEESANMQPITGKSLTEIFASEKSGIIDYSRDHILIGKERHDIGRPNDEGYPIRGIVKGDYLYIQNFEPNRWPAGNPETGYLNCDGSPTKTACLEARTTFSTRQYWDFSFGRRPSEELYRIDVDRECMNNLAEAADFQDLKEQLRSQMMEELIADEDPRALGNGNIFDTYQYAHEETRGFYERFMAGEKMKTGWVNDSDFETEPIP